MTRKYGCLTVERHTEIKNRGTFLRVLCDGVDVTYRCIEADDKVGRVLLVCHDKEHHRDWKRHDGRTHLLPDHDGKLCQFEVSGDVDIIP